MKDFSKIKVGSVVLSHEISDWTQIRDIPFLYYVYTNWGKLFNGLPITENRIAFFFRDFIHSPDTNTGFKYKLFKDGPYSKLIATFYGEFSVDYDSPINNTLISEGKKPIEYLGDFYDPFTNFFYEKNGRRINLKYIHEIQNLVDNLLDNTLPNLFGQF